MSFAAFPAADAANPASFASFSRRTRVILRASRPFLWWTRVILCASRPFLRWTRVILCASRPFLWRTQVILCRTRPFLRWTRVILCRTRPFLRASRVILGASREFLAIRVNFQQDGSFSRRTRVFPEHFCDKNASRKGAEFPGRIPTPSKGIPFQPRNALEQEKTMYATINSTSVHHNEAIHSPGDDSRLEGRAGV